MKILGIGNAIVDVICKVDEKFIEKNKLIKGTMKLIFDDKEFHSMMTDLKIEKNKVTVVYSKPNDNLVLSARNLKNVYNLFPILNEKKSQIAGELSGGQRQQLAVGRALMTNPVLLMLDEPSAGVSPIVMKDLFTKLKAISKMGTSILVVEQNAKQALEISNLGFVLQNGKNKYSDTGKALLQNPEVRVSFLGG